MSECENILQYLKDQNKYSSLTEITDGANAFSFLADQSSLKRQVFLKIYYFDQYEDEAEMLREPQALVAAMESSNNPNLVRLYDAEIINIGSEQYVCMQLEYVHGEGLHNLITTQSVGQQDAIQITMKILNGLSALHLENLLHRDLKPANILYNEDCVKIADFGSVAKFSLTNPSIKASKMSAFYRPIESWQPKNQYNIQSDIYQVGVILYELVNGCMNFTDSHYLLTKKDEISYKKSDSCDKSKIVNHNIQKLISRNKLLQHACSEQDFLSPKLKRIICQATNNDINRRFKSATDFSIALSKIRVPNWLKLGDTFSAINWHNSNWKIYRQNKVNKFIIEKSRSNKYRKVHEEKNISDAFSYVETLS